MDTLIYLSHVLSEIVTTYDLKLSRLTFDWIPAVRHFIHPTPPLEPPTQRISNNGQTAAVLWLTTQVILPAHRINCWVYISGQQLSYPFVRGQAMNLKQSTEQCSEYTQYVWFILYSKRKSDTTLSEAVMETHRSRFQVR